MIGPPPMDGTWEEQDAWLAESEEEMKRLVESDCPETRAICRENFKKLEELREYIRRDRLREINRKLGGG